MASRRKFSDEYKREAVRLATPSGVTKSQAVSDLGIHANLLGRGCKDFLTNANAVFSGGEGSANSRPLKSRWGLSAVFNASGGGAFMQAGSPVRAEGAARLGSSCTDTRTSSDNGPSSGSAYVYRFDGATWTQEQKLLAADREAGDRFGTSVAVVEDIIVVGAYSDDEDVDDGGINFGSAYVFEFSGGLWTEEQKLTASDGDANDFFGTSVAIDVDVIVVGADTEGENGFRSGAAYVYRRLDGLDWTENDKLTASDGDNDDRFGHSVDVNGDVAVVGAFLDENDGSSQGSAYAFEL